MKKIVLALFLITLSANALTINDYLMAQNKKFDDVYSNIFALKYQITGLNARIETLEKNQCDCNKTK